VYHFVGEKCIVAAGETPCFREGAIIPSIP